MDLLPTPNAADGTGGKQRKPGTYSRTGQTERGKIQVSLREALTLASSQGSEDSTLPLSPSGSDVSDRSNGTPPVSESSNDIGPTSPDGVTLLPTPDATHGRRQTRTGPLLAGVVSGETAQDWPTSQSKAASWSNRQTAPTSSAADSPASPSAPQDGARPRTITDGYGPSSPVSFAMLDPDGSWLRTSPDSSVQASLLGPLLARFSGTWPRSGSMHGGTVYAHPTLERPTAGSASSFLQTPRADKQTPQHRQDFSPPLPAQIDSLLHTPTTGDGTPRYDHRASPGYVRNKPVPNLDAQIADLMPGTESDTNDSELHGSGGKPADPTALLPTPTADHSRGLAQPGTDYQSLPNAVVELLPTPRTTDAHGTGTLKPPANRDGVARRVERLLGDHTNQPSEGGSE